MDRNPGDGAVRRGPGIVAEPAAGPAERPRGFAGAAAVGERAAVTGEQQTYWAGRGLAEADTTEQWSQVDSGA
jgi:hypothetical protein